MLGLDVDTANSAGVGVRGAAQRERLQETLRRSPRTLGAQVAETMARRMGVSPSFHTNAEAGLTISEASAIARDAEAVD